MKSWKARLMMVFAMLAMVLAVSMPAVADEIDDVFVVPLDDDTFLVCWEVEEEDDDDGDGEVEDEDDDEEEIDCDRAEVLGFEAFLDEID